MKDLIIIGAGPGGYELALAATKRGLSVLLIEKDEVGGNCLERGMTPTSTNYKTASLLKERKSFHEFGITGSLKFDYSENLNRTNQITQRLRETMKFSLKKAGVKLLYGAAKLVSDTIVQVNGESYQASYIIIATGSRPATLNYKESNNSDIFSLKSIPKKLVIVGAGIIGIEIASIYNQFGSKVEVIEKKDRILPEMDLELSKRLFSLLKLDGIRFHLSSHIDNIASKKVFFSKEDKEEVLHFDQLFIATRRNPNLDDLALEKVGIKYNEKGIIVNSNFQTNIPNIYAIGDVTGKMMFAHSAIYSAYHVLKHILDEDESQNFPTLPLCLYSFPELASAGLTIEDSKEMNFKLSKIHYQSNTICSSSDDGEGVIKVVSVDNIIKGVHIFGPKAISLIYQILPLLNNGSSINDLSQMIYPFPNLSERFSKIY